MICQSQGYDVNIYDTTKAAKKYATVQRHNDKQYVRILWMKILLRKQARLPVIYRILLTLFYTALLFQ